MRLWLTDGDPEAWAVDQCTASRANAPNPEEAIAQCLAFGTDPSFGGFNANGEQIVNADDTLYARNEDARSTNIAPDLISSLGTRYRWGTGMVGLDGMLQSGFGDEATNRGSRLGAGVRAKQGLASGQFWMGGRVSVYDWADPLRPDRDATSFTYVVAPEYRPADFARIRVEWEHSMNRLVGQRMRIMGWVSTQVGF